MGNYRSRGTVQPNIGQYGNTYEEILDSSQSQGWALIARDWAVKDTPVDDGTNPVDDSSKTWAGRAKTSEDNASSSETNAAASAAAALVSETNAASSEANAASSESNASASAAAAASSEANAANSAVAAANSEANAANSESTAVAAAAAASQSETNAGNSETAAAASAAAALVSEQNAATSAASLQNAIRNSGYFDPLLGSYPAPLDQETPESWFSTNNATIGPVTWTVGDMLIYVPDPVDPVNIVGEYYRVAGELVTGGAPLPLELLDDLIMAQTKKIFFRNGSNELVQALTLDADGDLVLGDANNGSSPTVNQLGLASKMGLFHIKDMDAGGNATELYPIVTEELGVVARQADLTQEVVDRTNGDTALQNQLDELEWKKSLRGQAELEQLRAQNRDARAASGFDHYGKHYSGAMVINEGMAALGSIPNSVFMGRWGTSQGGASETLFPVTYIAGFISEIFNIGEYTTDTNQIKFPDSPDGTVTYNSATGVNVTHADTATAFAFADADPDEEVVIDRHDTFGGEYFLEEVSLINPYVYPKGMIQSQDTSMNGITTGNSNRQDTYYAVFDGDTGSMGLGVDFWAATPKQRIDMASDKSNNLFLLDDGKVVQWRMRQRTIAGAGNGDWDNINPTLGDLSQVVPQGASDTVSTGSFVQGSELGVFTSDNATVAVDGECYFHVWGVVRRLNQGAYHPSFNSLGAAKATDGFWYESSLLNSTVDCFTNATGGDIASGVSGRDDGRFYDAIYEGGDGGVNDERLSAWDMSSKEEASKVFQKVVNGTFRGEEQVQFVGVIGDNLTSAYNIVANQVNVPRADIQLDRSGEFLDESDGSPQKASGHVSVNGVIHEIYEINYESAGQITMGIRSRTLGTVGTGATIDWVVVSFDSGSTVSGEFQMVDVVGDPVRIINTPDLANGWQGGWVSSIPAGVSKDFPLTRKSLDSTINVVYTANDGSTWTKTPDVTIDTDTNSRNAGTGASNVEIYHYTAFAKQAVEADNDPVFNNQEGVGNVVQLARADYSLLAESLMGKVCTSASSKDVGFLELESYTIDHTNPWSFQDAQGEFAASSNYAPKHSPVDIVISNDSPALKALWYQAANNQQVSLNFAWNELVWETFPDISSIPAHSTTEAANTISTGIVKFNGVLNGLYYVDVLYGGGTVEGYIQGGQLSLDSKGDIIGTSNGLIVYRRIWNRLGDWGDDSTISITDGTSTYTNLNGDTCLRGSATLSKPIGYSRNQARIGTQSAGVDL